MSSHDEAIICRSDERAPSSESAEKTNAEIVDSSIMICCCCSAESSVHRPCRISHQSLGVSISHQSSGIKRQHQSSFINHP